MTPVGMERSTCKRASSQLANRPLPTARQTAFARLKHDAARWMRSWAFPPCTEINCREPVVPAQPETVLVLSSVFSGSVCRRPNLPILQRLQVTHLNQQRILVFYICRAA